MEIGGAKWVEPVDISISGSNEHLEVKNRPRHRLSGNRLSTELSVLSQDKEFNEAMESSFKNNFLCLKSDRESEKKGSSAPCTLPSVVSLLA